jgi:hypothetical protein
MGFQGWRNLYLRQQGFLIESKRLLTIKIKKVGKPLQLKKMIKNKPKKEESNK